MPRHEEQWRSGGGVGAKIRPDAEEESNALNAGARRRRSDLCLGKTPDRTGTYLLAWHPYFQYCIYSVL